MIPRISKSDLEEITMIHRFDRGHSGCEVQLVEIKGEKRVLKKAKITNPRAVLEIRNNLKGLERMQKEGISFLLPDKLGFAEEENEVMLLMSYLGNDLESEINHSEDPLDLYLAVLSNLLKAYSLTLQQSTYAREESSTYIEMIKAQLMKNYSEHLIPRGLVLESSIRLVEDLKLPEVGISSFACWDLTPEDLFLVDGILKYPDPKADLRGIPIIDLACFAGVCMDSYMMKSSKDAYEKIKQFATSDVAHLFGLTEQEANIFFNLGRSLQSSLTSRFATDIKKAKENALKSNQYLQRTLEL